MYLNWTDQYWVLDIETDGLKPTVIWCVVVKNIKSGEVRHYLNEEDFKGFLVENPSAIFVGHNILSFDIPALIRLWRADVAWDHCVDTLCLSLLYNPGLENGHSLEAWGVRLKFPKSNFSDWSKYSEEMLTYCIRDVELTSRLYLALTSRMKQFKFSELSCEIEHKIRVVINEQQVHGFWFDRQRAQDFREDLRRRQSDLAVQIQELFPPTLKLVGTRTLRRNKAGGIATRSREALSKFNSVVLVEETGEYSEEYHYGYRRYECYDLVPFNLGSPQQRVARLLELGFVGDKFTKTGQAQVDEEALTRFAESPALSDVQRNTVRALADWIVLQGRCSMLDTWFNNLGEDSRIHGRVNSCGASTRRMTHSSPNTANIPSGAKARYGHECRSFWGVEPGRGLRLVGYDAAGLETAGLCHYLDRKEATEVLLRPKPDDIHTTNAKRLTEALGWPVDREWGAKTSWYAWLYGAYPPKLGDIVGAGKNHVPSAPTGERVVETFFSNVPGLKDLIEGVQYEWRTNQGRLQTIDGGLVWCPSQSAALNYKIQSAGAIVMKLAAILLRERAVTAGIRFNKVGDIHDEGQLEVRAEDADALGNLAVNCISLAGTKLGFRVPLTGDFKVGTTWAETH